MIIDFSRTAAYLCPACGQFAQSDFSLFQLSGGSGVSVSCDCGCSKMDIVREGKASYKIITECSFCNEEHCLILPQQELLKQSLHTLCCPDILIGLCFVGKKERVEDALSENEQNIRYIISACGLEHTGKNGFVILKALDRIQDLSESEGLSCSCGSKIIDVDVLEDSLILRCCDCGASYPITVEDIQQGIFSDVTDIIIPQSDFDGEE